MQYVDEVYMQKRIHVTATERLFHLLNIPLHLLTETVERSSEEDLFLTCWDIIHFAQQEACDDQIYKLWKVKINKLIEENDGYI
jgi:hypothetical protein